MRRRYMSDTNSIFDNSNYMTINALEDDVEIVYGNSCEYGVNGVGWYKYPKNSVIILNSGESVSFRNVSNKSERFYIKGQCGLSGNVMSLLFGDNAKNNKNLTGYPSAFERLFQSCTGIQFVSNNFLPATTLSDHCYIYMFYGCTSLTTAPALPATTLAYDCYNNMFYGCTSLTTAPALPATTLAEYCYTYMFYGCTSLVYAPTLPATILTNFCYMNMFSDCAKLNHIEMLATDISASHCLDYWVRGVSSTGTFVKNAAMTSLPTGDNGIPRGWSVRYFDGLNTLIRFIVKTPWTTNTYYAVEGHTWEEFVQSNYNTGYFTINYNKVYYSGVPHTSLTPDTKIYNDYTYTFNSSGGSEN